ncbi:catalase-related domain-containing protein [Brevibacillus centrosporus]|uniref:catalase-related domain-containing protein n=1 Tax=Brevibacillus centrosporus TaxID=54910 RepID=UPI000F09FCA1|nr:catalase-related domain-containing protein [Brevibacillus centrosporus]MEC2129139.1 catalase-related domain-containing protein [Brevibacillus centrosporus]RNB70504.1 hypothetical protein EDM55_10930 [Brevibacillus centrosporus]GED29370.1 hypothetical protein BCE02nite_05110 [Brevibacillus centrosporus]
MVRFSLASIPVNHQEDWTPASLVTSGSSEYVEGHLVRSALPKPDDFSQAGQFYRSLNSTQQEHLVGNLAADLAGISQELLGIVLSYLHNASPELEERVSQRLKR